jgi:hypothetical protein
MRKESGAGKVQKVEVTKEKEIDSAIDKLTLEELKNVEMVVHSRSHSGPLPDPQTLKEYAKIYRPAPEKIFNMAEKEQKFRHISTYLGQGSALVIGLFGLAVTAYLGVNGQPWLAGLIGFSSLGSLVGAYFIGNKDFSKNDEK